jgi:hypothetical protein
MMHKSIEMGRAFIIKEYQQNQCLFSIMERYYTHHITRFPDHKFPLGGVYKAINFLIFQNH